MIRYNRAARQLYSGAVFSETLPKCGGAAFPNQRILRSLEIASYQWMVSKGSVDVRHCGAVHLSFGVEEHVGIVVLSFCAAKTRLLGGIGTFNPATKFTRTEQNCQPLLSIISSDHPRKPRLMFSFH